MMKVARKFKNGGCRSSDGGKVGGTWRNIFGRTLFNWGDGQITTIVYPISRLVSTDFGVAPLVPGKYILKSVEWFGLQKLRTLKNWRWKRKFDKVNFDRIMYVQCTYIFFSCIYLLYIIENGEFVECNHTKISSYSNQLQHNTAHMYYIPFKNFLATCPSNPGLIEW